MDFATLFHGLGWLFFGFGVAGVLGPRYGFLLVGVVGISLLAFPPSNAPVHPTEAPAAAAGPAE